MHNLSRDDDDDDALQFACAQVIINIIAVITSGLCDKIVNILSLCGLVLINGSDVFCRELPHLIFINEVI